VLRIREAVAADEDAVIALADRLCEGVARWRDPEAVLIAVRGWVRSSFDAREDRDHAVLMAELDGSIVGFVTSSPSQHWSGEPEVSIGELVVDQQAGGQGIGSALVEAAMERARTSGYARISVSTGAANAPARALYRRLGFEDEDVSTSRPLV
jgi:ribosomal protein S18 acetylase RimI-like enzyme